MGNSIWCQTSENQKPHSMRSNEYIVQNTLAKPKLPLVFVGIYISYLILYKLCLNSLQGLNLAGLQEPQQVLFVICLNNLWTSWCQPVLRDVVIWFTKRNIRLQHNNRSINMSLSLTLALRVRGTHTLGRRVLFGLGYVNGYIIPENYLGNCLS